MSSHHDDERFLVYALPGLLPQGGTLVLHRALRVLSWITAQGTLVEQCRISRDDVALLMALLSAYPSYCPDVALLSARTGGSGRALCTADFLGTAGGRKSLRQPDAPGAWDHLTLSSASTDLSA